MADKTREEILAGLREHFPPEAIKFKDVGGGRKLSYVAGHDVLDRLDQVTNGWSDEVTWRAFRTLQMTRWNNDTRTKEPYEMDVLMVEVRLTIPELGTRSGMGVAEMQPNAGADVLKGAWTDAVKVAASKFGVARHLYQSEDAVAAVYTPQSGAQGGNTAQYTHQAPSASQRTASGSQGQGGGGVQNPPSDKQINLFNSLTAKLGIDREAVAQEIGNYPLDKLNKFGYIRVIDFLKKVETKELSWDGPSADYSNEGGGAPRQPNATNVGANGNLDGWFRQIANASTADRLDEISAAMEGFGLIDDSVIRALDKRADELGVPS